MAFDSDMDQTKIREAQTLLRSGLVSVALAEALMRDANPAMILASDGRTPLWSSDEAARRFGYKDAQTFSRARLPATAPGTQRLEQIGAQGVEAASPRLERLRFFIGFRGVVLTALCRVIPLVNGRDAILIAFPMAETAETPPPEADHLALTIARDLAENAGIEGSIIPVSGITQPDFFEHDLTMRPASDLIREARSMIDRSAGSTNGPLASAAPLAGQDARDDATSVDLSGDKTLIPAHVVTQPNPAPLPPRFLFALDAQGRLTRDVLGIEALSGANRLIAGTYLAEVVRNFDARAAEAINVALASGETWRAIRLDWPREDGRADVPVHLTALPLIDASHALAGFSGFGRIDRISLADTPVKEGASSATVLGPLAAAGLNGGVVDWVLPDNTPSEEASRIHAEVAALGIAPETTTIGAENGEESGPFDGDRDEGLPAGEFDQAAWGDQALDFGEASLIANAEDAVVPPSAEALKAAAADAAPLLVDDHDEEDDASAKHDADEISAPTGLDPSEVAARITPFPLPGGRRKADPPGSQNVVSILNGQPSPAMPGFQRQGLSMSEKNAFREIARALGARFAGGDEADSITSPLSVSGERPNAIIEHVDKDAMAPLANRDLPTAPEEHRADREQDNVAGGPNPNFGLGDGVAGFLDRLPLGLMVLKGEQPLFVNRTLLDLTAYPDFASFVREEGARAIFRKGIAPRSENRMPDPMVLATRDGEMVPVDAQLQLVDWDGSPATLISVRRAVELEQGKALRTVAMDLKRARTDSQELRAILDTATDGVLTLDASGKVLSMNGTAQALFGLHQNEIVGEHFTRLLANESHAIAMDYLDGLKLGGVRSVLNDGREVQGSEKNGGKMPLFMTLGRISEDDPPRFCAVLRDITAWKRAETDLTQARHVAELASAKKSDFLAKISHEIRTPMNAIIGFSEVMQEERLGPIGTPKYKEYLADIRTSGQHVVSLVNDLLDLAKIEAGRMELDFQATDLNAIVQSAVQIIQPQANTARVLVRSQLAQKMPPVVADERSVRQIVLNILSNATRFTESGGQVIVSTSLLEGGEAVIRIRDTGIGMSAPEIEQALEPFRQVGQKRNKGGTGLGLPLTKALVEANRANFAIRSQPGEGTLVEVAFPSTRVLAE